MLSTLITKDVCHPGRKHHPSARETIMTEHEAFSEAPYTPTPVQRDTLAEYFKLVSAEAVETAINLIDQGMSEPQATMATANYLIYSAALLACRTRRIMLGGEPKAELWRAVSERMFEMAVLKTAEEMTVMPPVDNPDEHTIEPIVLPGQDDA